MHKRASSESSSGASQKKGHQLDLLTEILNRLVFFSINSEEANSSSIVYIGICSENQAITFSFANLIHTLYNAILRIARNFLKTRENIKISTHPFYHINLG